MLSHRRMRWAFLSTPSARRATAHATVRVYWLLHFYPRPPRGGRLHGFEQLQPSVNISIHALREEGDRPAGHLPPPVRYFYPRPP